MLDEARVKLSEEVLVHPEIQPLLDFLAASKRGIIR
jgi:UDP-N-acetylglucosamine acyltransferase